MYNLAVYTNQWMNTTIIMWFYADTSIEETVLYVQEETDI